MKVKYDRTNYAAGAAPWQWSLVKLLFRDPRRWLRSTHLRGHDLLIETDGRVELATIIDSGEGGLGIKMRSELPVGCVVSFSGAGVQGRARVANAKTSGSGPVRVGLSIEEVAFSAKPAPRVRTLNAGSRDDSVDALV